MRLIIYITVLLIYLGLNAFSLIKLRQIQQELQAKLIDRPRRVFQSLIIFLGSINILYIIGLSTRYDISARSHIILLIALALLNSIPLVVIIQGRQLLKSVLNTINENARLKEKALEREKKMKLILEEHKRVTSQLKTELEDVLTLRTAMSEASNPKSIEQQNQTIQRKIKEIDKKLEELE